MDSPILRVMGMDVPLPYAPTLIDAYFTKPCESNKGCERGDVFGEVIEKNFILLKSR